MGECLFLPVALSPSEVHLYAEHRPVPGQPCLLAADSQIPAALFMRYAGGHTPVIIRPADLSLRPPVDPLPGAFIPYRFCLRITPALVHLPKGAGPTIYRARIVCRCLFIPNL